MCVDVNFKPWLSTGPVAAEMIRTGPTERLGLSGIGSHLFLADTLTRGYREVLDGRLGGQIVTF